MGTSHLFPGLGMAAWRSFGSWCCLFRQSGGRRISVVVEQVRGCNVVTLHPRETCGWERPTRIHPADEYVLAHSSTNLIDQRYGSLRFDDEWAGISIVTVFWKSVSPRQAYRTQAPSLMERDH